MKRNESDNLPRPEGREPHPITLRLVLAGDYQAWRKRIKKTDAFSPPHSSLKPLAVSYVDVEDVTNRGILPKFKSFSFASNTTFQQVKTEFSEYVRKLLGEEPKPNWKERIRGILRRIFAITGSEFRFDSPAIPGLMSNAMRTLAELGFQSGDVVVMNYAASPPLVASFWGGAFREAMKHERRKSLDDFLDSLITDERYSFRLDMWDGKNPAPLATVGAIVLYTEEDEEIAAYVRQHYASLHAMSGYFLNLYFFEHLPPSKGFTRLENRYYWRSRLPHDWFDLWSVLGLTTSKPYPNEYVYKIAERLNVNIESIPCVVLFRRWKNVQKERVIVPISHPISFFFRSFCTRVYKAIEIARGDIPSNEFIDSHGVRELLPEALEIPTAPEPSNKGTGSVMKETVKNKPNLFLCHSSQDKSFVLRLANDLRRFGLGVWLDVWEIRVGQSIIDRIEHGIRNNDFLVFVLSPAAVASSWAKRELNAALIRELDERQVVVIPVLYKECDVPVLIRDKRYADFRSNYASGLRSLLESVEPQSKTQFHEIFQLFGEPDN